MFNVLLDELPVSYVCSSGNEYALETDFRIGVQVALLRDDSDLTEAEKSTTIASLIFPDGEVPATGEDFQECAEFLLSGWYTDNQTESDGRKLMDFDVDQWRIYAAFRQQYGIDLNEIEYLHYWVFMGLLISLEECSYTRVIDIRRRKINPKMDGDSKRELLEAKNVYRLEQPRTYEEKQEDDFVDSILGGMSIPEDEKKRVEKFENYGTRG